MISSVNPYTGDTLETFALHTAEEVEAALEGAAKAQAVWRKTPIEERTALLRRMASVLRANKERYALAITEEMGKPIAESEAEVEKCALNCDHYADAAPTYLAPEFIESNATESMLTYEPLGVVLAIMPWNYPLWQYFRFAAPAFAAGNGSILKHANNVPKCALICEEVVKLAGAPAGLTRTLLVETSVVADLIADPRIAAVTLTGSTHVGTIVASQAGKVLKKQVLELGGSDPFIVLADADVAVAAKMAVKARFTNVGQSCVNAKRFIVDESIADDFVAAFVAETEKLKIGDPMERDTNIGPMARADLRAGLHDQVLRTLEGGGKLLMGGAPLEGKGFTYPPTIIDHVDQGMVAFCEETFGPVAAIIRVKDTAEAIKLANTTEYGLGCSLWTKDLALAKSLIPQIDAGAVFINGIVASDPRLPFGGIKRSGYGRELGALGIREFTNNKTVWIGPVKA